MQLLHTPLDVATGWDEEGWDECGYRMGSNAEVKALLREHGGKHSLHYVAEEGMLDEVAKLIEEGADVNQQDEVSHACNRVHTWCSGGRERAREREREREGGREGGRERERERER